MILNKNAVIKTFVAFSVIIGIKIYRLVFSEGGGGVANRGRYQKIGENTHNFSIQCILSLIF